MSTITVEVTAAEITEETSKVFGPSSHHWNSAPLYNHHFLRAVQSYCNDAVFVRRHLLLNDVYDQLGLPRTPLGAVLGWSKGHIVSFGDLDSAEVGTNWHLLFNANEVVVNDL